MSKATEFSKEQIDALRDDVNRILKTEDGATKKSLSAEAGIAYQTFHAWLSGTYTGDVQKYTGMVSIWLDARQTRASEQGKIIATPDFVMTDMARNYLDAFKFAQITPDICVVAGPPGFGKTIAANEYNRTNPNVFIATMKSSTSNIHGMMTQICTSMGVTVKSPTKLFETIGSRLDGAQALIIIDEAQHLETKALDELRALYDEFKVGIALVGNEGLHVALRGGTGPSHVHTAQLTSRIGYRVKDKRMSADDVSQMIDAWGIDDPAQVKFLTTIAGKPGALRAVEKTIRAASVVANGQPLSLAILKATWQRLDPNA